MTQFVILLAVVVAFLINWQLALRFDASPFDGFFYYLNTLVACVAVIALHDLRPGGITGRFATWCGDLSYPVFLAQWFASFVAWYIVGTDTPTQSWPLVLSRIRLVRRDWHRYRGTR